MRFHCFACDASFLHWSDICIYDGVGVGVGVGVRVCLAVCFIVVNVCISLWQNRKGGGWPKGVLPVINGSIAF